MLSLGPSTSSSDLLRAMRLCSAIIILARHLRTSSWSLCNAGLRCKKQLSHRMASAFLCSGMFQISICALQLQSLIEKPLLNWVFFWRINDCRLLHPFNLITVYKSVCEFHLKMHRIYSAACCKLGAKIVAQGLLLLFPEISCRLMTGTYKGVSDSSTGLALLTIINNQISRTEVYRHFLLPKFLISAECRQKIQACQNNAGSEASWRIWHNASMTTRSLIPDEKKGVRHSYCICKPVKIAAGHWLWLLPHCRQALKPEIDMARQRLEDPSGAPGVPQAAILMWSQK